MSTLKHILVPTDFGEPAAQAIELAIELARKFDAKITLLHVYEIFLPMPYSGATGWPLEEIESNVQRLLDAQCSAVRARFPNCEAVLSSGIPWQQITHTAQALGAELIVMGTRGRRGLSRFLLGSVSAEVVRSAGLPVLSVRARVNPDSTRTAA